MHTTRVIGPATERLHAAYATGEAWNGAPVLAFTAAQMRALIDAGDGVDSNGYGLTVQGGRFVDVLGPEENEEVPTITAEVLGAPCVLYVPAGRVWDEMPTNSTFTVTMYGSHDECLACGGHVADPHSPRCPPGAAAGPLEAAD